MIVRNTTASNVELKDLGITIVVGVDFDLTDTSTNDIADSEDLRAAVAAGTLEVFGNDADGNEIVIPVKDIDNVLKDGHDHPEYATKLEVDEKISDLVNGAPEQLNTLNELAAQLQDDSNALNAINTELAGKAQADHTHADLQTQIDSKAPSSDIDTLTDMLDEKADQTSLDIANTKISTLQGNSATKAELGTALASIANLEATKADQSQISVLTDTVNDKANQVDLNNAFQSIADVNAAKADLDHGHADLATKDEVATKAEEEHSHSEYHERVYIDTKLTELQNNKANKTDVDSALAQKANLGHIHPENVTQDQMEAAIADIPTNNSSYTVVTISEDTEIKFNHIYIVENKTDLPLRLTLPAVLPDSDDNPEKGQILYVFARYGKFDVYSNANMLTQRIIRYSGFSESSTRSSIKLAKGISDFAHCRMVMLNESGADVLLIDWGLTLNKYVSPVSEKDKLIHFTCEDGYIDGNNLIDQSGNDNHGLISNITQTHDGFIGQKALYANDKNKPSIIIGDSEDMHPETLGIFCKFKLTETNSTRCLFSKQNSFHWIFKSGKPEIMIRTWNGYLYAYDKRFYVSGDEYHQCGITYDGERLKVFLDGVKIFDILKWSSYRNDSLDPLYLFFRYSLRNYMSGMIDEFIWFKSAPSEEEAIALTSQPRTIQEAVKTIHLNPAYISDETIIDQSGNNINAEMLNVGVDYGVFDPDNAVRVQHFTFDDSESLTLDTGSLTPVTGTLSSGKRFNQAQFTIENAGISSRKDDWVTVKFWAPRNFFDGYEMPIASGKCGIAFQGNYIGLNTFNSDMTGVSIADISNDGKMHQYIVELKNGDASATKVFVDAQERETVLIGAPPDDNVAYLGGDNGRVTIGAADGSYMYNSSLDDLEIFNGRLSQDEKDVIFESEKNGEVWESIRLHDPGFIFIENESKINIPFNDLMNENHDAGGVEFVMEMTDEFISDLGRKNYGLVCRKNCWNVILFNGKIAFMHGDFDDDDYDDDDYEDCSTVVSDSVIEFNKEYRVSINLRGDEIRMAINGIIQSQRTKLNDYDIGSYAITIGASEDFDAAPGLHIRDFKFTSTALTDKQMIENTL